MVFPLFDDNTGRHRFPFVTYAFILINVLVFIFPQRMGDKPGDKFTYAFSTVPKEIVTGEDVVESYRIDHPITKQPMGEIDHQPVPLSVYLTLLTSMFMHGGWAHLLGNMLFLWIFGDNVEDHLGHIRYILFYIICGILASLSHVAVTYALGQNPMIPSLGASGAISGVLGGYLLLHPHRRVTVILFRILTAVPAWVAIGIWFAFQIINSMGALGDETGGGVAYGAHIGGFLFGLALIKIMSIGLEPSSYNRSPRGRY